MYTSSFLIRLCPLLVLSLSWCSAVLAINDGSAKIVISNDDGWATANIRAQNSALREAGHNVSLVFFFLILQIASEARTPFSIHILTCSHLNTYIRSYSSLYIIFQTQVIISAPAENKSGSGSLDFPPGQVGSSGCEFDSCPPNSPATGSDPDDSELPLLSL